MTIITRTIFTAIFSDPNPWSILNIALNGFVLTFVITAWGIAIYTIINHLIFYNKSILQRLYVRVILVLLVFSLGECLIYFLPKMDFIFQFFMTFYEGYALYCIYAVMILYTGDEKHFNDTLVTAVGAGKNPNPCCCFGRGVPCLDPKHFYLVYHFMVAQLMFVRPLAVFLMAFVEDNYGLHDPMYRYLLIGLCVITLGVTLGTLMSVYRLLFDNLREIEIEAKFLSIKILIFVLIVQSLAADAYRDTAEATNIQWESIIRCRAFLSVFEIFICAIFVCKYYSHIQFLPASQTIEKADPTAKNFTEIMYNLGDAMLLHDVFGKSSIRSHYVSL